jgi:hypothetical protein
MQYILYLALLLFVVIGVLIFTILYYTDSGDKLSEINNNLGITGSVGKPYELSVSQGEVSGSTTLYKFGYNPGINNGDGEETIWSGGGDIYWPTTATKLGVSSSSPLDNGVSEGDGARTVEIFGLDSNYNEKHETLTLNGLSIVHSSNSYLRVFRSFVTSSGLSEFNVGTITIGEIASTNVLAEIPAKDGQTQMAVYTVPAGKTFYTDQINFTAAISQANKNAVIKFRTREFGTSTWRTQFVNVLQSNRDTAKFDYPRKFLEKTDLECRAITNATGTNLISATFQGTLIDS